MKKVKWFNVLKLLVFIGCIGLVLHSSYVIICKVGLITSQALATYCLAWYLMSVIYDDFNEQLKNTKTYQPRHAKGYSK